MPTTIQPILFFLFISVITFFVGKNIADGIPVQLLALIIGVIIGLITFLKIDLGVIILILSMLLSPEIEIVKMSPRELTIRLEDFILMILFFAWLARILVYREIGLLRTTPLNVPIIVYTLILIFATIKGIVFGIIKPIPALFFLLKYIEYFFLYFMVLNILKNEKQIKRFLLWGLVTAIAVNIYCYATIGQYARLTTPFEGGVGEQATLGGYLLIIMGALIGLIIYDDSLKRKVLYIFTLVLSIVPFLLSLSRASFIGFIPLYLTIVLFSKRLFLLFIFAVTVLLSPFIMPEKVKNRIRETFAEGREYQLEGRRRLVLEESAALRVESWKWIITERLPKQLLLGYGPTGVGLADAQIPRILGETGILGFFAFVWIIYRIFKHSIKIYKTIEDRFFKGLTLGFIAAVVGLLFQSIGANTFVIVRIMEPFWFLTAIVMVLPDVCKKSESVIQTI